MVKKTQTNMTKAKALEETVKKIDKKMKKESETPREIFVRLAESRTVNVVKKIRSIGKLFGKNYKWSIIDFELIEATLVRELKIIENKIVSTEENEVVFSLTAPMTEENTEEVTE